MKPPLSSQASTAPWSCDSAAASTAAATMVSKCCAGANFLPGGPWLLAAVCTHGAPTHPLCMCTSLRQRKVPPSQAVSEEAAAARDHAQSRSARGGCVGLCRRLCLCLVSLVVAASLLAPLGLVMSAAVAGRPLTHEGVMQPLGGINFALMRFARDISRAKARRRRFNQRYALVPLLLGKEEPLPLGDPDSCVGCISFTRDELAEFDGRPLPDGSPSPLYLSVLGRVYDVSSGGAFYGPSKSYHKLVGKDATRAFCTGCLAPSCLISSTAHLSETQRRGASPYPRAAHLSRRRRSALSLAALRREAQRWVELYEWHDKYTLVGRLREEAADPAEEEMALFHALEAELSGNHRPFEM